MTTGAQVFAIQTTLNEIKKISPDVLNAFFFSKNGEIIAKDDDTNSETANHATEVFNALTRKADAIGGLETLTFYGSDRRMNISRINDSYVVTVAPKESDEKYTNILTSVLIPAVLRITDDFQPVSEQETIAQLNEPEFSNNPSQDNEETSRNQTDKPDTVEPELEIKQAEPELEYEPSLTEPSATQFIIENLGGLLVSPDTVRIDNTIILDWKNLYGDREIREVDIETLDGQTIRCKLKPIKDSKLQNKGIIQMPQRIQLELQTSEGELVMVKPVIE